ncbi:hypothetical protein GCM10009844_23730 [Nocardioides koreensis]|uniref:Calcium-binding protein n=1 Tax=Nocardioides koreensis TaxID=433651 RepID=A0ABP5LJR2_9ACTN
MHLSKTLWGSALAGVAIAPVLVATTQLPPATAAALPTVEIVGDAIVFTAAPGVDDGVIIFGAESGVLNFGGVTGSSFNTHTCTSNGCDITGIDRVVVRLRDGNDVVYADIPWHVPPLRFVIHGGPGNDSIGGNAGHDDRLFGGAGDDWIRGYSGGDLIHGGRGHDVLRGGKGLDLICSADGVADKVHGGLQFDTAYVDERDTVDGVEQLR